MPRELVAELWKPEYLERLARSYWRWLSRATLGLIRVVYADRSRSVVLLSPRLPLLSFHAPEYETGAGRGCVTWRIDRGPAGRARGPRLRTASCGSCVERPAGSDPAAPRETLAVRLEVRNFYPWLRGSGRFARLGAWLYAQTQLRIHVLVCNAFLRSLAPARPAPVAGRRAGRRDRRGAGGLTEQRVREDDADALQADPGHRRHRLPRRPPGPAAARGRLRVRCLVREPDSEAAEELERARLRARGSRPDPPGRRRRGAGGGLGRRTSSST